MIEEILINVTPQESRVAVIEQGVTQELHVERASARGLVGNICMGRVLRVLPGMQSAFIDIGGERAAFLHVADIWGNRHAGEHDTPIEKLLAEALVLTALFGSLLKEPEGQVTLQAQTEAGAIELMVCDYLAGELRGYIRHNPERLADVGPNPSLFALFGKGYLAITFDHPVMKERYQGIVPLEGDKLDTLRWLARGLEASIDREDRRITKLTVFAGRR